MEAKQYLENLRFMMKEKTMWEAELENIDELMVSAPAIKYDSDKITSSPRKDGLEMLAINHLEKRGAIINEINELITELIGKQKEALEFIKLIESDDQREILILYYIKALSWREILNVRNKSDLPGQWQLRDRAIRSLQKIFDEK